MKCKKHPAYKAIYPPRAKCKSCRLIWVLRCARKLVGLQVAKAKPRAGKPKLLEGEGI